jgi:hypothetical protein
MTLPRLDAVLTRWEKVPPLSVTVLRIADVAGVERPSPSKRVQPQRSAEEQQASMQELAEALGMCGVQLVAKRPANG